jgi:D-alanyl-D-alanine carboxypeptidase
MQPTRFVTARIRWLLPVAIMIVTACSVATAAPRGGAPANAAHYIDDFDAWVASLMARTRIPGLSIVVVQSGSVVRAGHYGLSNVELNVPVTEETSFKIASMSKAFTAAALMLLVEDGSVGLDDPVMSHLEGLPPAWRDVTLRQLLNNTSGLSNDWDLNPGMGTNPDEWTNNTSDYFLHNTTDDAFLRALADLPLLFAPGARYSYAAGTFVIGLVIEKVSGMPYAEFMRSRIFEPLGMSRTMINDASRLVPHRASGYRLHHGELMNGHRISQAAEARGDVGVLTTALDLARWDAAMRDTRLLSQASLDLIATPARLEDGSSFPYGLGWNLWPVRGFRTMSHGGTFRTGFSSDISRYVDADLSVIVVANLWRAFFDIEIGQEIASFYDQSFRLISTMQPRSDPDPDRSHRLRSVIGLVGRGSIEPAVMIEEFPIGVYTLARWQERHEGLREFSFVDCRPHPLHGADVSRSAVSELCFYSFADPRGTGYLVYSLTRDGRVADLYDEEFRPHSRRADFDVWPAFQGH